jgi:hypothetical protein
VLDGAVEGQEEEATVGGVAEVAAGVQPQTEKGTVNDCSICLATVKSASWKTSELAVSRWQTSELAVSRWQGGGSVLPSGILVITNVDSVTITKDPSYVNLLHSSTSFASGSHIAANGLTGLTT